MKEELKERADARLEEALGEQGLEDVRPAYRELLSRLREEDAPGYEEAVRRFEEELLPAVAKEGRDPLSAWVGYGLWLARRLADGRTVSIDGTGMADTIGDGLPKGLLETGASVSSEATAPSADATRPLPLILHLPGDDPRGGIVLAAPADPTDPQAVTRELLCG